MKTTVSLLLVAGLVCGIALLMGSPGCTERQRVVVVHDAEPPPPPPVFIERPHHEVVGPPPPPVVVEHPHHEGILAPHAPPPVIEERIPPPGHGHVWVPGFHEWKGGAYVWMPGHYEKPPRPAAVWVQPTYTRTDRGWLYTPGYWR